MEKLPQETIKKRNFTSDQSGLPSLPKSNTTTEGVKGFWQFAISQHTCFTLTRLVLLDSTWFTVFSVRAIHNQARRVKLGALEKENYAERIFQSNGMGAFTEGFRSEIITSPSNTAGTYP